MRARGHPRPARVSTYPHPPNPTQPTQPTPTPTHLVQAAGLKAGGHEQQVRPSDDAVRDGHRKAAPPPEVGRVGRLGRRHASLQLGRPRAQHHRLHAPLGQAGRGFQHQVGPLLVVEATDPAHQRGVGVDGKAQLGLQGSLARGLARHGTRAVVGGQVGVGGGVPLGNVDAVGHAVQHVRPLPEHAVQPPPTFRRLNFPRIPPGHRHHPVRGDDRALEHVDSRPSDGRPVGVPPAQRVVRVVGQAQGVECDLGLNALVGQVVDDKDAAGVGVHTVPAEAGRNVERHQPGVPVVGDERHLIAVWTLFWPHRHHQRGFAGGERQEGKAELVVTERAVLIAVRRAGAARLGLVGWEGGRMGVGGCRPLQAAGAGLRRTGGCAHACRPCAPLETSTSSKPPRLRPPVIRRVPHEDVVHPVLQLVVVRHCLRAAPPQVDVLAHARVGRARVQRVRRAVEVAEASGVCGWIVEKGTVQDPGPSRAGGGAGRAPLLLPAHPARPRTAGRRP